MLLLSDNTDNSFGEVIEKVCYVCSADLIRMYKDNPAIKQNDLLPILEAILQDVNENPVDLGSALGIVVHLREEDGAALKIEDGVVVIDSNPATGKITYAWVSTDTDTNGLFLGEFEVTWPGDKKQTFPSRGYISVEVINDLA